MFLADLEDFTVDEVKKHIVENYSGQHGSSRGNNPVVNLTVEDLDKYRFLVAYESVGSWGCDSSSFFLFEDQTTGTLYEVHGSHCSCYGFEGQWFPEETSWIALNLRCEEGKPFSTGGYDDKESENQKLVAEYIKSGYALQEARRVLLKDNE